MNSSPQWKPNTYLYFSKTINLMNPWFKNKTNFPGNNRTLTPSQINWTNRSSGKKKEFNFREKIIKIKFIWFSRSWRRFKKNWLRDRSEINRDRRIFWRTNKFKEFKNSLGRKYRKGRFWFNSLSNK